MYVKKDQKEEEEYIEYGKFDQKTIKIFSLEGEKTKK